MVNTKDVINAVMREIEGIVPGAEHYLGGISEGYKAPAFLYLIVYNGCDRTSRFIQDTTLDLQIVYFTETDGNGNSNLSKKLEMADSLKLFLNRFELTVGDRVLKFEYEVKDADKNIAIFLTFHFKDGVYDSRVEEADEMESAQKVYFKERVI